MRPSSVLSRVASYLRHLSPATIGAALGSLVLAAGTVPMLASLAQPGTSTSNEVIEYFAQGTVVKPDRIIGVNGFHMGDHGWYLDPGASGRLVYRVPGYPGTHIGVNLWLYMPDGVTNSISISAPGLSTVRVASNVKYLGDRVPIPAQYASASSVDVQLDAQNASAVQEEVLDELVTYSIHGDDPRAPPFYTYLAFGGLVGLLAFIAVRRRPHALALAIGTGVVASIAAATRISALFLLHPNTDPDAAGYRIIADGFQWLKPFDDGIFGGNFLEREPLFPMVVHIYFQVLGSSDFHERVVSATLSVAVAVLAIVAARRRMQTWWAPVLVGLMLAISGPLIQESDRGLRLELEMLLILSLYLSLDRGPARRPLLDAAAIGLLGAAMALARTYFIPVFVVAVAVSFLVRYRSIPKVIGLVAVATLIMGAAEAAHRVGVYEHTHNAYWDSAQYIRWNANEELFRFHRPLPHPELFPTLQQYQTLGTYTGPPISTYQYFLVIHSPTEVIRDSLAGTTQIFASMDSFIFDVRTAVDLHTFPSSLAPLGKSVATRFDLFLRWTVLLGLISMCVAAWRDRRLLIIPAIVATWLGLTAFLFNHGLIEQYRHTWQTYPLVLIAGAWLLEKVWLYLAPRFRMRSVLNADAIVFAAALALTPATFLAAQSVRYAATALVTAGVIWLSYRRPAWGLGAALIVVSAGTGLVGAAVALAAAATIVYRLRPPLRPLAPLLALIPLALAMAAGRSVTGLETAATMVGLVTAVTLAARDETIRDELLWLVAAVALLAGFMYILHPSAPGAVVLTPLGVAASAWLYVKGHRLALALGLLNLVLVVLIEPFAAWIAVAAFLAWIAVRSGRVPRSRRLALAGALALVLAALTAVASLAATTPPPTAAWSTRLDGPSSSVLQQITVDRTGDTSLWVYARRSTALTDFPFSVLVNGNPVTSDLNSVLPTDVMTWNRIPLGFTPRVGDRLEVRVVAGGTPNPVDRYIELGGVYASVPGINSRGVDGTYLVVLGDDAMPLAPYGLPEPMVRNRLQPPMGVWMPGEWASPVESRQEAAVLQIWSQTLTVALRRPFGVGTGNLGSALQAANVGIGPGLTARSEALQALGEWGFLGAAALVLLLGVAAWSGWRARDALALALLGVAVITMVGESLLAEPAGAAGVWLAVGFCFGAIASGTTVRSTSPASDGEMRPETSQPEATRAG